MSSRVFIDKYRQLKQLYCHICSEIDNIQAAKEKLDYKNSLTPDDYREYTRLIIRKMQLDDRKNRISNQILNLHNTLPDIIAFYLGFIP